MVQEEEEEEEDASSAWSAGVGGRSSSSSASLVLSKKQRHQIANRAYHRLSSIYRDAQRIQKRVVQVVETKKEQEEEEEDGRSSRRQLSPPPLQLQATLARYFSFQTTKQEKDNGATTTTTTTTTTSTKSSMFPTLTILPNDRCGSWYVPPHFLLVGLQQQQLQPTSSATTTTTTTTIPRRSCYFKSTDGHVDTWAFSLKRLNLHVLDYYFDLDLERMNDSSSRMVLIVDSSVRKMLPDSLRYTIPIWACVLNRICLKYRAEFGMSPPLPVWDTNLYIPADPQQPQEEEEEEQRNTAMILEQKIEAHVETLYQCGAIVNPRQLVDRLTKPLRPLWMVPKNNHDDDETEEDAFRIIGSRHSDHNEDEDPNTTTNRNNGQDDYFWIVCLNPSRLDWNMTQQQQQQQQQLESPVGNNNYFWYQAGAGDDEESWARHLTPDLFWKHYSSSSSVFFPDNDNNKDDTDNERISIEDHVDAWIDEIVATAKEEDTLLAGAMDENYMNRISDWNLWIGSRRAGRPPECWNTFDVILNVTNQEYDHHGEQLLLLQQQQQQDKGKYYLQLPIAEGKRDKTELERWMPVGLLFLIRHLQQGRRILVHCNQGKDRSVAMVLALMTIACRRPFSFPPRLDPRLSEWDTDWATVSSGHQEGGHYKTSGLLQRVVDNLLLEHATGQDLFLEWVHEQRLHHHHGDEKDDDNHLHKLTPLADKESFRIALHLLRQDRPQADPTRSTMQKLNRFFMSSPLYREEKLQMDDNTT